MAASSMRPSPPSRPLSDPLSDVTRKERTLLLAMSLATIVLVKVGLVPTKISALGIEFGSVDQRALLILFGLVTAYFLATFAVYAVADWAASRMWYESQEPSTASFVVWAPRPVKVIRAFLDFLFPVLFGVYAIFTTFTAPHVQRPQSNPPASVTQPVPAPQTTR
jgi:hypothetical protein